MYSTLCILLVATLAYPYYGQQPSYYSRHQIYGNEPILRGFGDHMGSWMWMNQMQNHGTGTSGTTGHAVGGAGAGGHPASPWGPYAGFIDAIVPGLGTNPMGTSAMYGIDAGDYNDIMEGAMKGDYEKIANKVYDGNDMGMLPMMMGGLNGMFGGQGQSHGAAHGGQTGMQTGQQQNPWSMYSPYLFGMMDMLNKPAITPVNARLMRARVDPNAVAPTTPTMPAAGTGMGAGMNGGMYGSPAYMQKFMNAMHSAFTNPAAQRAMSMTLDSGDMKDINDAMMEGDFKKMHEKTIGKGFNPMAFYNPGQGASTGTTPGAGGMTPTPSFPPMPSFFNPFFSPQPQGQAAGQQPQSSPFNFWMFNELFDGDFPFFGGMW